MKRQIPTPIKIGIYDKKIWRKVKSRKNYCNVRDQGLKNNVSPVVSRKSGAALFIPI
jgi:hypothetical protein